jgi:hypothetical protein
MATVQVSIMGTGNGFYTVIDNIEEVAASVSMTPKQLQTYFAKSMGMRRHHASGGLWGVAEATRLQELLPSSTNT